MTRKELEANIAIALEDIDTDELICFWNDHNHPEIYIGTDGLDELCEEHFTSFTDAYASLSRGFSVNDEYFAYEDGYLISHSIIKRFIDFGIMAMDFIGVIEKGNYPGYLELDALADKFHEDIKRVKAEEIRGLIEAYNEGRKALRKQERTLNEQISALFAELEGR